jgi:hypothetical protein
MHWLHNTVCALKTDDVVRRETGFAMSSEGQAAEDMLKVCLSRS